MSAVRSPLKLPWVGCAISVVSCMWLFIAVTFSVRLGAQDGLFHNAPASVAADRNPYAGQADAVRAGPVVFTGKPGGALGQRLCGLATTFGPFFADSVAYGSGRSFRLMWRLVPGFS